MPALKQYWSYYDDDYPWEASDDDLSPDIAKTLERLGAAGFSEGEALELVSSGYVSFADYEFIIDRYYGGALLSVDNRTRFTAKALRDGLEPGPRRVKIFKASSWYQVDKIVADSFLSRDSAYAFRGQTLAHTVTRTFPNPALTVEGMGEISLIPSIWRKMLARKDRGFQNFRPPTTFDWSEVFYQAFDMQEVEARHQALLDAGNWVYTVSDMEDCGDPLVSEFGRIRGDLLLESDFNLACGLATLLQHYGLLSPLLDLSTDLEVAKFFATHRFVRCSMKSDYAFVGTNGRKAVIYVLRYNQKEMRQYETARLWERLLPMRPLRQSCVVSASGPYAINLPADFIRGIILLDFDCTSPERITRSEIFPDQDDKFFSALSDVAKFSDHITRFGTASTLS